MGEKISVCSCLYRRLHNSTWPSLCNSKKIIEMRWRAGDESRARVDAEDLRRRYETQRERIVNIYRAEALHPLAEAYETMGDRITALAVYRRALEEGVVNPNSRPRAEDLAATCCSMAVHGVEPDEVVWTRIMEIAQGLGSPW